MKPFTFVFEDPRWIPKILLGGLFYLATIFIIGAFFILGYCARLARNVVAGMHHPLPEWDDLGEFFGEGLRLFAVICVFLGPLLFMGIVLMIPAMVVENLDNDILRNVGGAFAGCMWCLMVPVVLTVSLFLPAALMRTIVERRFSAAFEIGSIWQFVRANIGNYLLAFVVTLVARFLGGFGVFLLCIGMIFTGFWALVAGTYAYAQVWRLEKRP